MALPINTAPINTVLYDACVLYPATLRDLLIELACTKKFQARWTTHIHEEWSRNLLEQRPDLSYAALERTITNMNKAVPGCLIHGFEHLIPTLELPDPNDRHILAAAIQGEAQYIITFNLRDFPQHSLEPYGIEALHPDIFVSQLIHNNLDMVLFAIKTTRARLKNPPRNATEHLERLHSQGLVHSIELLKKHIQNI
jgi:predicted nucleic acid-binding protein